MLPGRWWQRSAPTWSHFHPRMIWRAGWESVPGTTRAPGNERAERLTEETAALGEPYAKPRPVTARQLDAKRPFRRRGWQTPRKSASRQLEHFHRRCIVDCGETLRQTDNGEIVWGRPAAEAAAGP